MRAVYSRARRLRQDISRIYTDAMRNWSHGDPLPVDKINEAVETLCQEVFDELAIDMINELHED